MRLIGRRIHIAGSATPQTDTDRLVQAHKIVEGLVRAVLREGATLVMQAGPESRSDHGDETSPALVFDWTIAEAARTCIEDGTANSNVLGEPLIFAATSEKAVDDMPAARRPLWQWLLESDAVRVEYIRPGHRSGAALRALQAREGNLLVTLGGGAGVEHLAELYGIRRHPVIPLDAQIGASRDDGTLGGEGLARIALSNPTRFFRSRNAGTEGTRLSAASTQKGTANPANVVERLMDLLIDLELPSAFFVRLINNSHPDFRSVESFFRNVVEPVVKEAGYRRHEVGTDVARAPFINVEIFEELYHAPLVVADITELRPNCLIELGYALRGEGKVMITAKAGTDLPFDTSSLPCHFWNDDLADEASRASFGEYWRKNIDRPPLVTPIVRF